MRVASVFAAGALLVPVLLHGDNSRLPGHDSPIVCGGPDADAERTALLQALRRLPYGPAGIAVIDAHEARPEVGPVLLTLDAFVVRGSRVVYVVKQSRLLRGAAAGSLLHVHALAAVIWHEMAHLDGADEHEARRREQALWTQFVRDGSVDALFGLRYLAALERRAR